MSGLFRIFKNIFARAHSCIVYGLNNRYNFYQKYNYFVYNYLHC